MTDIEWATTPLLRPENIGKYVWSCWNGNFKHATRQAITKIGRTNITCDRDSYRVDGEQAYKPNEMAFTECFRAEMEIRKDLSARYYARQQTVHRLPIDQLRVLVEMLEAVQ